MLFVLEVANSRENIREKYNLFLAPKEVLVRDSFLIIKAFYDASFPFLFHHRFLSLPLPLTSSIVSLIVKCEEPAAAMTGIPRVVASEDLRIDDSS